MSCRCCGSCDLTTENKNPQGKQDEEEGEEEMGQWRLGMLKVFFSLQGAGMISNYGA